MGKFVNCKYQIIKVRSGHAKKNDETDPTIKLMFMPGVDDVYLVQRDRVNHLFALLELALRTLHKPGARAYEVGPIRLNPQG